jgi:catechol 2,3-dioxygenase-like lactoylglutathione lyase family enzyme
MFFYLTLGAHDLAASGRFYDPVLKTVGLERIKADAGEIGYGTAGGELWLWVLKPQNKLPATFGNGTMLALTASSRADVDAFYEAALANGGYDEGKPGIRGDAPSNWYACYVRDPAGNKLSAVYNKPE